MKLARVRLRNFRCYQTETAVDIGDITALVGKNDSGKSSILDALAIFFDDGTPDAEDPSIGGNKADVRIICEFEELPHSLVIDADHPTNLTSEYLLNEQGRLEIHKVYNGLLKSPKLTGVYAYAMHPTANGVADLLLLKNADLKKRAQELRIDIKGIDTKINTQLRRRIWESIPDLRIAPTEVLLNAESAKQVWEQLRKHLPAYALFKSDRQSTDQDVEAQDPMKAAVKEAIKAKEEELDAISQYVEEKVKAIAEQTVAKLREMDPALASQLNPRFTPPTWANVFKISLTGDNDIPINKRGSGVRRLILLNFFRAKAEQSASDKNAPGVIYAVEEPETSQHPDNQKMLIGAFSELAEQPDCQVILSTHTPMLARILPVDALRYIAVKPDGTRQIYAGGEDTNRMVAKALGVLPDHNVKLFIGVEGVHDISFLKTISRVLIDASEDVPDLEKLESDGRIIFIPVGGSNLVHWTSRLAELNRPEFHLFDRDAQPPQESPHQAMVNAINARPGCFACLTGKREIENYLHADAIRAVQPEVGITFGDFDDVPNLVAEAVHKAGGGTRSWAEMDEDARKKKVSRVKGWLNTTAIASMTPTLLDQRDPVGDVRGWLTRIAELLEQRL